MFEKINLFFESLGENPVLLIGVIVTLISFICVYFSIFKLLSDHKATKILIVYAIFLLGFGLLFGADDDLSGAFFIIIPVSIIITTAVLYSTEIKRYLWGRKVQKNIENQKNGEIVDEEKIKICVDEIIKALQDMSKNDVGAIIVLSNDNVPKQVLDSGVKIDSEISSQLIESIFFPKTPLHDGAMIINGTKIVSAGCFLPLSQNLEKIPKDLGTRHRAGLGITETIDVISLIVSEETGIISIAKEGTMTRYADNTALKKILSSYFWQDLKR